MIIPPTANELGYSAEVTRGYERGFRAGHKIGYLDSIAGIRTRLYWFGRDARPNWYEQGYNNGYCIGSRGVKG